MCCRKTLDMVIFCPFLLYSLAFSLLHYLWYMSHFPFIFLSFLLLVGIRVLLVSVHAPRWSYSLFLMWQQQHLQQWSRLHLQPGNLHSVTDQKTRLIYWELCTIYDDYNSWTDLRKNGTFNYICCAAYKNMYVILFLIGIIT